ncbi:aldo/keto reductase [Actinopolymorpha alba]|uniref:aldo/keto reductase n=1 Tax=Actinopolymorpha alba TaxID=533267 RepID=UPI0003A6B007|nr:aldo/keto reductase [Actinopolymorpha alba]
MDKRAIGGIEVSGLCLGAMMFGTTVDEDTSFALLDAFLDAGGTFIDTANCYQFWDGGQGHESEELLGRWLKSRGLNTGAGRDQVVIATKVGARPDPDRGDSWPANNEGLSARVVTSQIEVSLRRMGLEYVDLYYSHHEDRSVPVEETVGAFASVAESGKARALGVSNEPSWRIERARQIAASNAWPSYVCVQQRHTYLQPRPGGYDAFMPAASDELLDYVREDEDLTLIAYSPLMGGRAYSDRADKQIDPMFDHRGTPARLAALRAVADELGATKNQVVLAWMRASSPSVLPLFSASSLTQLKESIGSTELTLTPDQMERLDQA